MENSNKIVRIKTEHCYEMKVLFDVLKDILTSVDITFLSNSEHSGSSENKQTDNSDTSSSDEDEEEKHKIKEKKETKKVQGGMKIVAVDVRDTLMIYVKLNAENFSDYYVKYKSLTIGLDLRELYKFMKGVDKEGIMTISINKEEQQKIEFHLNNPLKSIDKYYRQKLLDTDDNIKRLPKQTEFEITVMMDTQDFKKICGDLSQFSEYLEIRCSNKEITFSCVGDISDYAQKLKSGENENVKILSLKNDKKTPYVQGIYNLKHLTTFSRCVNLCDDIQLYLRNSYPLFIHYNVGSLGKMYVGFTQVDEKVIKQSLNINKKC